MGHLYHIRACLSLRLIMRQSTRLKDGCSIARRAPAYSSSPSTPCLASSSATKPQAHNATYAKKPEIFPFFPLARIRTTSKARMCACARGQSAEATNSSRSPGACHLAAGVVRDAAPPDAPHQRMLFPCPDRPAVPVFSPHNMANAHTKHKRLYPQPIEPTTVLTAHAACPISALGVPDFVGAF